MNGKEASHGNDRIIENLNPRIMGWCSYFNKVVAKRTFIQLDRWMWMRQARFACRRHPNKYWKCLKRSIGQNQSTK
ncbi:group II intron, maturase-specific domain protein [Rickettsia hoogstraalii str. RCCE3]|nr:group II intron, maturase-specific domain protein [Rickettsia hoogstraalii str. RCCE3]